MDKYTKIMLFERLYNLVNSWFNDGLITKVDLDNFTKILEMIQENREVEEE